MKRFLARRESGATAVEFALVMVPLLMIVFGIIQYSFYFWSMQGGSDAARQAARLAAVGKPVVCTNAAKTGFKDVVRSNLSRIASNASTATVTRTYTKAPTNTQAYREVGDQVKVTVIFNGFDFNLPFVPFIDNAKVSSEASARVDYVPDTTIGNCS